jgi:hypothetical protein
MEDMGIFRRLSGETETPAPFKIGVTVSAGQSITLPLADCSGQSPNIAVNWGDSSSSTVTSSSDSNRIHTYASAGSYTITISGSMPAFVVSNASSIRSAITSIIDFGRVNLRNINFYGCSNLTSIPASGTMTIGYEGLSSVASFANFMRSTGVTSIPSDIFSESTNALIFTDAFSFLTGLTTIPSGLFQYNTLVTNFSSCFNACNTLSSVPSNLFDTNINVINFSSTFRNCRALTSPLQFTYNTSVTTFQNVYLMSGTNSMAGTAPTLWTRVPEPLGTGAFFGCTGLTNYASIPSNWK